MKPLNHYPDTLQTLNKLNSNVTNLSVNLLEGMIFYENELIAVYHRNLKKVLVLTTAPHTIINPLFKGYAIRHVRNLEITISNWNQTLWNN